MFESSSITAARTIDIREILEASLATGPSGIPDVLSMLNEFPHVDPDTIAPILSGIVDQLLQAFRVDPCSPTAYAALAGMRVEQASVMFDLALIAAFGDGERDVGKLNKIGTLCLIGLLSASGAHEQAAVLIAEARKSGNTRELAKAAWFSRCRWAACDPAITTFLGEPFARLETLADAQARVETSPLRLDGHRARVRLRLAEHDIEQACNEMAIALALPMADSDKQDMVGDLAVLVAVITVRDELAVLSVDRLRWALAAAPGVTKSAATAIEQGAGKESLPFLDDTEAASAAAVLRSFVVNGSDARLPAVTGFPMRNGKPHVDTVWLEITNHCNQKCTFCPDMFREDARTWLPLDQVKQLIDQLADTISVGSMQLNAYGEPLLHPNIAEILTYIRERKLAFPTFFTSHGMTLVDKKLKQLSGNYPAGIAISLHNDSQESYEATRSSKIGDYETLVARVTALLRQMAYEQAPSHLRLYQMVSNGKEDLRVDSLTRSAFPDTFDRMLAHVRKWEAIAEDIASGAPVGSGLQARRNEDEDVRRAFIEASHGDVNHLPILTWVDQAGHTQTAFMSARPVSTYANLLLEYDPRWSVERKLVNQQACTFTSSPSLAIFATGKLGMCCVDLNSTATFGSLSDFDTLHDALTSPQALQMFAQLSNGVTTSRGCQICLGGSERHCASDRMRGPVRPAGHFADGI